MSCESCKGYQEALNKIASAPWIENALDPQHPARIAKQALAAEPDEPTVSKSVEELVEAIEDRCYEQYCNSDHGGCSTFCAPEAEKLIQSFLDAQMAERDKRIAGLESELERIKYCSEGILLRMEGKRLDSISKIQLKSFIEKRGTP